MNWWANAMVWAIFVPQIQNTKKKNRLQADGGYGSSATGVKMKKK